MEDKQFYLSPDLAHRLAAIDVGTNSIRLVVAEAQRDGQYRVLTEEKETTRLGKGLSSSGRLNPAAVERSIEALRRMKQIAAGYQARELRVIGTCALREAADGGEFGRRLQDAVGLEIEVISAKQEADLAFVSVSRNFHLEGKDVAVCDIGGGSTEIILASGDIVEDVCTTPLGAVRMTDLYADADDPSGVDFPRLIEGIDRDLRRHTRSVIMVPHLLIGSGGTFTALAEMTMAGKGQSGLPLRGYEVTHAEVGHLLARLRKLPVKLRRVPGLSPDRADIIVAGVAIIDRLLHRFRVNRLQVHDRGVRDGLLLTMIDASRGSSGVKPHDEQAAVERFAAGCGSDLNHARQVARLAGSIFEQLAAEFGLDPADRRLLEAAAKLQDVGYLINYEKHHKHSYHLILNSRLHGFQPHELELVANIARYHRGNVPKKKHDNFTRLSSADQHRVRVLASILRLAGGFDRSMTQQVRAVVLDIDDEEIRFRVVADEEPEVDLWAARRRAEPFEDQFERKVVIEWQRAAAPAAAAGGRNSASARSASGTGQA